MKLCFEIPDQAIKLEQSGRDNFTVTYGRQIKSGLSYEEAAGELGECIMHAMACEGKLDNTSKR